MVQKGLSFGVVLIVLILGALAYRGISFSSSNSTTNVFSASEGNFSTWDKQFNTTIGGAGFSFFVLEGLRIDDTNRIVYLLSRTDNITAISVQDGHIISSPALQFGNDGNSDWDQFTSINNLYLIGTDASTNTHLLVMKAGVLIFDTGVVSSTHAIAFISISANGRTICLTTRIIADVGNLICWVGA